MLTLFHFSGPMAARVTSNRWSRLRPWAEPIATADVGREPTGKPINRRDLSIVRQELGRGENGALIQKESSLNLSTSRISRHRNPVRKAGWVAPAHFH